MMTLRQYGEVNEIDDYNDNYDYYGDIYDGVGGDGFP